MDAGGRATPGAVAEGWGEGGEAFKSLMSLSCQHVMLNNTRLTSRHFIPVDVLSPHHGLPCEPLPSPE